MSWHDEFLAVGTSNGGCLLLRLDAGAGMFLVQVRVRVRVRVRGERPCHEQRRERPCTAIPAQPGAAQ